MPGAISHVKVSLGKIQNPKFPVMDPFLCAQNKSGCEYHLFCKELY